VAAPESLLPLLLGKFGLPKLPRGALSHLKYPIVIDTQAFRSKTGFTHQFDEYDTLQAFCEGVR
jgi:UDP-glucose 4-epimerase